MSPVACSIAAYLFTFPLPLCPPQQQHFAVELLTVCPPSWRCSLPFYIRCHLLRLQLSSHKLPSDWWRSLRWTQKYMDTVSNGDSHQEVVAVVMKSRRLWVNSTWTPKEKQQHCVLCVMVWLCKCHKSQWNLICCIWSPFHRDFHCIRYIWTA